MRRGMANIWGCLKKNDLSVQVAMCADSDKYYCIVFHRIDRSYITGYINTPTLWILFSNGMIPKIVIKRMFLEKRQNSFYKFLAKSIIA